MDICRLSVEFLGPRSCCTAVIGYDVDYWSSCQVQSSLTVFVHADLDAFAESAGPALIPVRLIHHARAFALGLADVLAVASN